LQAAEIALVLTERGLGSNDVDLAHRLDALRRDRSQRAEEARRTARRWAETVLNARRSGGSGTTPSPGAILALAYPDRVAKNRGGNGSFLLANGRGANVDLASPLSREPYLAVAEISGTANQSRILLAAAISSEDIEEEFGDHIVARDDVTFDPQSMSLRARTSRQLGAIALSERPMKVPATEESARKLAEGIAAVGLRHLTWTKSLMQLRDRVNFVRRAEGEEWPDLSDEALAATVADWLAPMLVGKTAVSQIGADDLDGALAALLSYKLRRKLDDDAPTHFTAPSGSVVPIDYEAPEGPKLSIRVQELFGLNKHPSIAGGRVPLVVELLSPAHRPVQLTRDLPGFWRGSYADVRTDMRGRYPRHPWPEDPTTAPATRRAKPRGT
jgi:ATP-dependent helicase HrpB